MIRHRPGRLLPAMVLLCAMGPERTSTAWVNTGCQEFECGKNKGDDPAALIFRELHVDGVPNDQGASIVSFHSADGVPLDIDVVDHFFRGITPGGTTLTGAALVGARLRLNWNRQTVWLEFMGAHETDFWTGNPQDVVPAYEINIENGGVSERLCPSILGEEDDPTGQYGGDMTAILFEGDRYDFDTKTVAQIGPATDGWFNIACAGSVASKMHLMRYTDAGSDATHTSTIDQRTALYKLYVCDVCGTGKSFTETGMRIAIGDEPGWFDVGPVTTWEAIWNENGAACLDVPRLAAFNPMIADDLEAEIELECGARMPPPCHPYLGDWENHGYFVSGNPPP